MGAKKRKNEALHFFKGWMLSLELDNPNLEVEVQTAFEDQTI
jgi:hypothetical protein